MPRRAQAVTQVIMFLAIHVLGALTYTRNALGAQMQVHVQVAAQVFMLLRIHVLHVQHYMKNVRHALIQVRAPHVI